MGKPRGARHEVTLAAEALLDGEAEALTRKAVELALSGDVVALKLCMERILPARRERPIQVQLPELNQAADASQAMASLIAAAASGRLTLGEATELAKLLAGYVRTLEAEQLEQGVRDMEERHAQVERIQGKFRS